jgi:hypothetical protein
MVRQSILLLLLLFAAHLLTAQTPGICPSNNTPAADLCENTCIYCNLQQYVGSTIGYSDQDPPGFCGTIENEQWLGFVAGATFATISVVPENCVFGNGVQVAIYPDCFSDPLPGGCNGGFVGGGNTPMSVSVSLTPGNVYYLMVDAYAGDLCDFTVMVSPPGGALNGLVISEQVGLCPGETFLYDGVEYSAPAVVTDTIQGSGDCDTILLYNLVALDYNYVTETIEFCAGDTVYVDGIAFTEPGTYVDQEASTTGGCDTFITYTFIQLPLPTSTETITLQSGESAEIGGNSYFAPDTVQIIIPAAVGCDTLATYVLILDETFPDTCAKTQSFLKSLGEAGIVERGEVICAAADGNFYIGGTKDSESLLMKVTPNGEVLWSRTFRPDPLLTMQFSDLIEDSDGMLAGCGTIAPNDISSKGYVFRYNPNSGDMVWSRVLQQQSPETFAIVEKMTSGGNFLLLTSPQLALNIDDAEVWELNRDNGTLVGGLSDRFNYGISDVWTSMVIHDGALYVTGRHIPTFQQSPLPLGKMRMGLTKIDLAVTGAPVWSRLSHLDTNVVASLRGNDLIIHDDAIVAIYSGTDAPNPGTSTGFFLQKTDLEGNLSWVKKYNVPGISNIEGSDIQQVSDGYLLIGQAFFDTSNWNKLVVKTDFNGNVLWAKKLNNSSFATTGYLSGNHQSVVVGDVLFLAGTTDDPSSNVLYLKMTSDGEVSDNCDFVEDLTVQSQTVPNPVNIEIQVPVNQFIVSSTNTPVAVTSADMPFAAFCAQCCDTTLIVNTIEFCPGDSVVVNGEVYTESTTFSDTIVGTIGCDTIITYNLILQPNPTFAQTIEFCPGESVTIGGVEYTQSGTVVDTIPASVGCDTIATYTLVLQSNPTFAQTIEFCPGESVTIGGNTYTQSGTVVDTIPSATGGCDTIATYTLVLLSNPTFAQTIEFCPGESVSIGGNTYTQPGTVVDTISASVGCDTIATYTLVLLPNPTISETIEFCEGDTIFIGGNAYTQPGTVNLTIPSASGGCDTIATYVLEFITSPNSSVTIVCPDNIDIATDPGTGPIAVNYNLPSVSSDCECPGIALALTSGLPSGSLFPVTTTQVCYQAKDSCDNTATCCFNITIREEQPCDVKTIGCMKYELLDITRGSTSKNLTYRVRATNSCSNKMIYTAIQLPDGLTAVSPANNSVYTAPSNRQYDVRNPNYSPFYSIRFKSQVDSIANGQSDIFEYTLPPQINPSYIHITSRLYPQIFHEAYLNTFNCPIEIVQDKPADRTDLTKSGSQSNIRLFPNPTSGALFADFSDWQGEQLKLQVFDSRGQRVQLLTVRASDTAQPVELPEVLSNGLYFLDVLRENGEKQAIRFVIQR